MPFLNQLKGENDRRKYFTINLHERMLLTWRGSNPQSPDYQSETHPPRPAEYGFDISCKLSPSLCEISNSVSCAYFSSITDNREKLAPINLAQLNLPSQSSSM